MSTGWLLDPRTREPSPAIPEPAPHRSEAAHWAIERDATGMPVRMRFRFCDDPACCPTLDDILGADR